MPSNLKPVWNACEPEAWNALRPEANPGVHRPIIPALVSAAATICRSIICGTKQAAGLNSGSKRKMSKKPPLNLSVTTLATEKNAAARRATVDARRGAGGEENATVGTVDLECAQGRRPRDPERYHGAAARGKADPPYYYHLYSLYSWY